MDNVLEDKIFVDGVEYRYVKLRGRGKYIARDGRAINPLRRNQEATININADGYPCYGGGVPIHMYVAHAWVDGYFDGAEVNHKDFDKMNYNADNLEWISHKENVLYSMNNSPLWKNSNLGIRNGIAHFTKEQILEIRKLYDSGVPVGDIMRTLFDDEIIKNRTNYKNIYNHISRIGKRLSWKCVPEQ